MDKIDIQKNIRDLEYQHLLNMQNIFLGFIGAAIITVLFLPQLPQNWPPKEDTIFLLAFLAVIFFFYFREELKEKIEAIQIISHMLPSQNSQIINRNLR